MTLTSYERRALKEIARQLQDEDPILAAGLTAEQQRTRRHYGAEPAVCCGLLTFMSGAVLCPVMPVAGVWIGVTGFLILLAAARVLLAAPARPGDHLETPPRHWLQQVWGALGGSPPNGPRLS